MRTNKIPESIVNYIEYSPNTGVCTWINHTCDKSKVGTACGGIATDATGKSYIKIQFKGIKYSAHRIAWFLKTGTQPPKEIDHFNGDGLDNSWNNLRASVRLTNAKNLPKPITNSSGFKGVSKKGDKFQATICSDNVQTYIGIFDTPQEAHTAYCKAADELHGDFANYG